MARQPHLQPDHLFAGSGGQPHPSRLPISALEHVAENENALFKRLPMEALLMGDNHAGDSRSEAITTMNADAWLESLAWTTGFTPKKGKPLVIGYSP